MADDFNIIQRLAAVKNAIGAVGKDSKNVQQGFNFRGVDAVVNAAAPALNAHEVVILPEVLHMEYETVEIGRNKTPMAHVTGRVKYTFTGSAGDSVYCIVPSEAMDSGDKAVAKFMSVAYRIALLQVLNLPTDEPDPDSVSYERSGGSAETAKTAKTADIPKNTETADSVKAENYAKSVKDASSAADLNTLFKAIGADGGLDWPVVVDDEKLTLRDLLYRRNDEVGVKKSSHPAAARAGTGRGAK